MTTIATIALPAADSWQIGVGGGWIVLMLIGMAVCFVAMFAFMGRMGDAHGWPICGFAFRWPQDTTRTDIPTDTAVRRPESPTDSSESEARP